jgi:hypothetical protein
MTDLNTLIPSDSSLELISTGDIDDRGEITGQACVLSNGACTSEQPAFLAIPDFDRDDKDWEAVEATGAGERSSATVPENVREQLLRRLAFGHLAPEPVK